MDPPPAPPRRRAIPRPWLEKQQQEQQQQQQEQWREHDQDYTTPFKAQKQHQQYQQQPQMIISPMSFEMVASSEPMILLEKPNPWKSFFKMDWCCKDKIRNYGNDGNDYDQHYHQRPSFGVPVRRMYHASNTNNVNNNVNNTTHTPTPSAPAPALHHYALWNYAQSPPQHQHQPLELSSSSPHDESCASCSSFLLAPRPTVIFVIQGNPSTIHMGDGTAAANQHHWHQSYLSIAEDAPPQRPRVVQQRTTSFDTSMTSLSVDVDSLAISDDLGIACPQQQRRYTEDDATLFLQHQQCRRRSSIPRPPRLLSKSLTTGNTNTHQTASSNTRPPMVPSATGISKRPSPLHKRSSTTGSTTSSTNSRHRRSLRKLDRDILQRLQLKDDDTDDDDDDTSTIATDGENSPIFPFLQTTKSSPRSQEFERKEEELYMPKNVTLEEQSSRGDILLSGWVAYSMGDSLLQRKTTKKHHLAYLVIYDSDPTAIHLLQAPTTGTGGGEGTSEGVSSTSLKLPKDEEPCNNYHKHHQKTTISVQTVESPGGRSVIIQQQQSSSSNPKILLTLLPVNLPVGQFDATTGIVKNSRRNIHRNNNASVAQHDAALYLWFGLDGWMRRRRQQP